MGEVYKGQVPLCGGGQRGVGGVCPQAQGCRVSEATLSGPTLVPVPPAGCHCFHSHHSQLIHLPYYQVLYFLLSFCLP